MGSSYSSRVSRPIGLNDKAFGGAGLNLGLEAIAGETDMITTFDDFNGVVKEEGWDDAANWETSGWVLTEDVGVASVGDLIHMNDPVNVLNDFNSCITIYPGTADSSGGNMQLDAINGVVAASTTNHEFPHIWIPETATIGPQGVAGDALDNNVLVFACRIGLRADDVVIGDGNWNGAMFIGWAAAGDTSIIDHDTGVLTTAEGNLHGFHICLLGEVNGVSKRDNTTAIIDGTNETELYPVGSVDGTLAAGAGTVGDTMWFDLALRMDITDQSLDAGNGYTTFYKRGPLNKNAPTSAGRNVSTAPGEGYMPWIKHGTVLENQTPNHTIALVPTIEVIASATATQDCIVYVDWWAMGRSRRSR